MPELTHLQPWFLVVKYDYAPAFCGGFIFFLFPHKITHLYGVGVVHANVTEIIDQKGRITLNANDESSTI